LQSARFKLLLFFFGLRLVGTWPFVMIGVFICGCADLAGDSSGRADAESARVVRRHDDVLQRMPVAEVSNRNSLLPDVTACV